MSSLARPTVGIVLAGGAGERTGLDYPKQLLRIGGRTVLEHTLASFEAAGCIDEVVVVIAAPWIATARSLVAECAAGKVSAIIPGGGTRNASTRAALDHLSLTRGLDDAKLLIHDAVRPLVSVDLLERCACALDTHDAADTVIETDDTIVEVDADYVTAIPPRERLRRGQTPQAFSLRLLRAAYAALGEDELARFTDDCSVVMRAFPDVPVLAVPGASENMKITRAIDIYLADRLLQVRQSPPPEDRNAEPPAGAVVVIGGSSGIGAATVELLRARGCAAVSLSRRDGSVDVRDEMRLREALERVRAHYGPLAAVVNCAGLLTPGELISLADEQIERQIDVNLLGSINVARAAHAMLAETAGHLVLFTSSSYTRGRGGYAVYSATKAAVVNLAQALAEEWHGARIKVNCINPARTATAMRTRAFGAEDASSLLDAGTVAAAVGAVLASEQSGHVYDVRLERGARTAIAVGAPAAA